MFLKRLSTLLVFLLAFCITTLSQASADLSNIRVDELSDEQIQQFVNQMTALGIGEDQVATLAEQRGLNPLEALKLKERIQSIRTTATYKQSQYIKDSSRPSGRGRASDSALQQEQRPVADYSVLFGTISAKHYGADVFNNPKVTFEPNLRLPTPDNYTLAADDELLIDVSGYSEANYKLKVSPEGLIRIPIAGPVFVNGMTILQAKESITKKLASTIYSGIKSKHTFVDVVLGAIRTIKVTIVGEAAVPGTYSLPSLATAYNALYACGGINNNGSYRNIQIIRHNELLGTIDLYKYLATGKKENDIRLQDQDVISITTYSVRVELKGEVKRPGLYDVEPGETLTDILAFAGGFTDYAYTASLRVFKNSSRDRQVSSIAQADVSHTKPAAGDSYVIGRILNRFSNRVSIRGAIYRPGEYELKSSMTLSQLIKQADGIREDAYINRGIIHRLGSDLSPSILSFDIAQVLNGRDSDLVLRREDRVNIFSKFDLKEGYFVNISGEVAAPGYYLFESGMTVQDLIVIAGGLKESAYLKRVEVARRITDGDATVPNTQTAIIFQQDLKPDLRDSAETGKFQLRPFDEISIHPAPGYFVQKNVVIEGEVIYAGKYSLQAKNDHISDLVQRAGGLTPQAYKPGAVLVRTKNFSKSEENNYERGLNNLLKQNYVAGASTVVLQNQLALARRSSDNVGIDLERILESPQSEYNLLLNDGDTLRIPKFQQTVRIDGEVLYPALIRYDDKYSFKDYIIGAGGFTEKALRRRAYMVYANGSVRGTKSFLFIRNYPKPKPGGEIYIPIKRERERLHPIEYVSIGATLVTMLAILFNAFAK